MDDKVDFFRQHAGEPVPSVNIADLKAAWEVVQRIEERHGTGTVATASSVLEAACSPGADVRAIGYRCAMLRILERWQGAVLQTWRQDGPFHDSVFRVVATIPMTWIGEGAQHSLPFDVNALLEELGKHGS